MSRKVNSNDFTLFDNMLVHSEEYARKAYRANPKNLWVYLEDDRTPLEVVNISISGICFKVLDCQTNLIPRQMIRIVLASDKREFVQLTAQIVRVADDQCSCFFPELLGEEESMLDKLILEMQKHEILQLKLERQQRADEEKQKMRLQKQRQKMALESAQRKKSGSDFGLFIDKLK